MEPVEYLKILRRRWPLIVAAFAVAVAGAWVTTPATPAGVAPQRSFTATHTIIQDSVSSPGQPSVVGAPSQVIGLDLLALLTTTGEIPEKAVERLGLDEPAPVVASKVTAQADATLGTLAVSVTDRNGDSAALLANTFAEEALRYVGDAAERNRQEALDTVGAVIADQEKRVRALQTRIDRLPEDSGEAALATSERDALLQQLQLNRQRVEELNAQPPHSSGLYTLEKATPVPVLEDGFQAPSSRTGRVGLAALLGLAMGVGVALALEQLDTRVRTRRGAERAFGLPVVAEIPKIRRRHRSGVVVRSQPASFAAEAFRILRLSLQLMPRWILPSSVPSGPDPTVATPGPSPLTRVGDEPARVVLVTSASPCEGKTSTVANLAASFAEVGKAVIALDCDFRHPQLHHYLGAEQGPGVADYLTRAADRPDLAQLTHKTAIEGVRVVPAGTPAANPGQLVGPDQRLVAAASELADVVVIDAGPMLAVNDPAALLPDVDAVVVVARSGRTTAEAAHRTREFLSRLGAPLLGVALVGVPRKVIGRYHDQYLARSVTPRRTLVPAGGDSNSDRTE